MKSLLTSKVFWTCISAIIGAAGGWATGELDWRAASAAILTAIVGIFFRDSINTAGKAAAKAVPPEQVRTIVEDAIKKLREPTVKP